MSIQKLRLQHGWSQQLAEASGLSARTIQRVEAGHPASTETLAAHAAHAAYAFRLGDDAALALTSA